MTIKYSILSKDQIRAKIGIGGLFKISGKQILQVQDTLRDELEKDTLTYLDTYSGVLKEVSQVFTKNGKNIQEFINTSEAEDRINIREIMKAYNKIDETLRKGIDQGHVDVGVLSKQLLILYVRFDQAADKAEAKGPEGFYQVPTTTGTERIEGAPRGYDVEVKTKNKKRKTAAIRTIAEEVRRLYIMSKAVDQLDNDTVKRLKGDKKEIIRAALDEYFEGGQIAHSIEKTKTVDIITGEGTQKIELDSRTDNRAKGLISRLIGIGRGQAINKKLEDDTLASLMKEYGDQFTQITGSRPLEKEIVDQIMTLATGKKTKK